MMANLSVEGDEPNEIIFAGNEDVGNTQTYELCIVDRFISECTVNLWP